MQPRKRRRKPIIDFVLIAVLASLTAAVVLFVLADTEKNTATEKKEKANHISTESSAFEGISITTDASNNPNIPYALHYPKTEDDAFNKEVRNYVSTAKKAYLKELSDACIKTVEVRSDKNDEIVLDGQFNSVDVYSAADIKTKENTSTVIRGKNLDAKSNATIYVPDKSDVKVRNFNEDNISGDGKIDALSESI